MSAISTEEIKQEFLKSKIGLAGIGILLILIITSIVTIIIIPADTFKQWNNPSYWISFPKTSTPVWVNILTFEKIPEHQILGDPITSSERSGDISVVNHQFNVNFEYDDFPNDFIYEFTAKYSGSPLLQISVIRPDGMELDLLSTSLPNSKTTIIHSERIFSTDPIATDSPMNNARGVPKSRPMARSRLSSSVPIIPKALPPIISRESKISFSVCTPYRFTRKI